MEISIKDTIMDSTAWLDSVQIRQVPYAVARAINATAKDSLEAIKREMISVFDRPTPYTLNAFRIQYATKQNWTAIVEPKNRAANAIPADKYLAPEIEGGSRNLKRFERALVAVGAMPQGYRAVPGAAAQLDAYGNMSRGQIVQILSFFRAFPEMGYRSNMTNTDKAKLQKGTRAKTGFAYFVGRPGNKLPLGIWQKFYLGHGTAIKPIVIFVSHASYHAIFNFNEITQKVVETKFGAHFTESLDYALRTAK